MRQSKHNARRQAKQTERLLKHLHGCGAYIGLHGQELKQDAATRLDTLRRKAK
jgi:hypothetical protein